MTEGTLEQDMEPLPEGQGCMHEMEVLCMARDIFNGLHMIHSDFDVGSPVLHLNIKPANISK